MLRSLVLGLAIATGAAAAAQTMPVSQPMAPGSPQPQAQPAADPGAVPLPPMMFVSAGYVSDNMAPRPRVIRISGGVMIGLLVHRVMPVYPPGAIDKGQGGMVKLRILIDKSGAVKDAAVISGPPVQAKADMDAVRQWTYRPYLLNGEPVDVLTTVRMSTNFSAVAATPQR